MYEERRVSVVQTVCTCDRCGLEMRAQTYDGEWEERLTISFRGGYYSVFGDGSLVELDLCQRCVQEVLGPWLSITEDDPIQRKAKPRHEATRAYQDYQLKEQLRSRRSLMSLFAPLQNHEACLDEG